MAEVEGSESRAVVQRLIGSALAEAGRHREATACFEESLRIDPSALETLDAASLFYLDIGEESKGAALAQQLADALPDLPAAWARQTSAQMRAGYLEGAIAALRRLRELTPENAQAHSTLLHLLIMDPRETAESLMGEHVAWQQHSTAAARAGHENEPVHGRTLRIGVLTGEVAGGAARFFVPPVLRHLDRSQFQLVCFCTHPSPAAALSEWRELFAEWHEVYTQTADEIDGLIRAEGIDIMLDVSGHFPYRRLEVLAQRPAPVQLAWPQYPATTGLDGVDRRLSDEWADPPGTNEAHYSEKLARLPGGYLAYEAPNFAPPVAALPAASAGFVTFGFFQSPLKLNAGVLDVLAGTLRQVPESRLLLHYSVNDFDRPGRKAREWIADAMAKRGVARDRLSFRGTLDLAEHLALVAETDIALDAFPYSGQTTTCECLWMGVPVVTLAGDRFASRVSAAILHRAGLGDWVAANPAEYVAIASGKAADLAQLAALRGGLRRQMAESPVCDGPRVAREMGAVIRQAWREWCTRMTGQAPNA